MCTLNLIDLTIFTSKDNEHNVTIVGCIRLNGIDLLSQFTGWGGGKCAKG